VAEPSKTPDPRRNLWRADCAAENLRGLVECPRFIEGQLRHVAWASVPVRKLPDASKGLETELLFGESVHVYETADGWAWVQATGDRYVGYVPAEALVEPTAVASHTVRSIGTFLYPEPDIKTPPAMHLSLNSQLSVLETRDRFAALATGGFVMAHHLADISRPALDYVALVERCLGTPYLWGGRTRVGLDCSGLVQLALQAAGIDCPRDTDMQRAELGDGLEIPTQLLAADENTADVDGLQRGDLVFWPGHIGVMTDGQTLVHANGHHMSTVAEPVLDAAQRIKRQTKTSVIAVRRLSALTATPQQTLTRHQTLTRQQIGQG
jgi:cell wall-associated NlpC family hydrolase